MLNIKSKRRENEIYELSKHFQNAEIVIRQELDTIFEKTTQSKTRDDNKKILNHEFSKNDTVDYTALVEKQRARSKN